MRTFFGRCPRSLFLVSFLALSPLAGCGGELYLNADDVRSEFDAIDRDPTDDDQGDGGDGVNGDGGGDTGDIDGDSLLGDGFGDFDGDGGGGGCGFNPDPCPSGQECVEGACVTVCPVPRCEVSRACCGAGETCVNDRFCLPACPNPTDQRCGSTGELCCNFPTQICGESLTCVQNCGPDDGPLCGTGTLGSFGSVCCNGRNPGTDEDDDVCVFNRCVARGGACESFLDCEAGEYCELTLHEETGVGEPDTGYCLPNDFPADAPVCQDAPTDLFQPTTEWSWVGVQLVGDNPGDDVSNNFVAGQVIPPCADSTSTNCYREPCTDNFVTTGPGQALTRTTNFNERCYRSIWVIPTTADIDQVDVDPSPTAQRFVPEVAIKAYPDAADNSGLMVIMDGRADAELPGSGAPPTKQQRSKVVIFGARRGHFAIGNLDGDPQLELVEPFSNGVCVYDPYDSTGAPVANALKSGSGSCVATGSLSTNNTGAAPQLSDLDGDGDVEIVLGASVLAYDGATGVLTQLIDLGFTEQGDSYSGTHCQASGADCYAIVTVADLNRDGFPEMTNGRTAWTIRHNAVASLPHPCGEVVSAVDPTWRADCIWQTSWGALTPAANVTLTNGFPGVGDFVDNSQAPYCATPGTCLNTPEVAVVHDGAVFIVSGETGEVVRSPISPDPLAYKLMNNRGGAPNIADFDGDGRPEVSFAGTGCVIVIDPDCAAADAAGRDALVANPASGCNRPRPVCTQYLTQGACAGNASCTWAPIFNGGGAGMCVTNSRPQATCTVEVSPSIANEIGVLWMYETQDQSSAATGTSVFDFQGDGKAEVLYNDECFFRVFDGETSNLLFERPNSHRTLTEYPIVVDVDGDSNSEIVVVSTGDQSSSYTGDRDRCAGAAINTVESRSDCSSTTSNRTCSNRGGCGLAAANTCQRCDQFTTQNTCVPTKTEITTACTARGNTGAACTVTGGCGLDGGNNCVPCGSLNQTQCTSATNANGCYWNAGNTTCYAACDVIGDRTGDGDTTNVNECNATPACVSLSTTLCAQKPNGCVWNATSSTCQQSCATIVDGGDANTNFDAECTYSRACDALQSTCKEYAYRRNDTEKYKANACTCADHTAQNECDAARGCQWSAGACVVVTAADCAAFSTRATCQAHMDDCLWDPYQGASGTCEENPRGQGYICYESTWGVTAFGDPSNLWVRTLPYWHEHAFHITNEDRFGTVVPDWAVCYPGAQCAAQTAAGKAVCEATYVTGSSGALCQFGEANVDFYNNFRQNVPGFVPLNAPDLQIESVVADLLTCPPTIEIIARIINKGRAGIRAADADITFYRLTNPSQTALQTAQTVTPFARRDLPQDLLPGGAAIVRATYTVPSSEAPIGLDFRVIANPEFLTAPTPQNFECNDTNNSRDILDLDCTDIGG